MTQSSALARAVIVVVATSLVAFACGSDDGDVASAAPTTAAEATASATSAVTSSSPTQTSTSEPDGAAAYQQYCAQCHGVDLRGTDQGPSQLSIIYEPGHHGDYSFRAAIRDGSPEHHWWFGDMPPVEGISDSEIEAVIMFVRAEQERLGFEQ